MTLLVGLKNRPTVRLVISNPGNGQKGCSSEVLYRSSYTKEAKMKSIPWLDYSFKNIFRATITWKLVDFHCHNEFAMQHFPSLFVNIWWLIQVWWRTSMFWKRTRGVLPTMAHTGRVRPKRKPYLAFMYIKEWGFTSWSIWKSRKIYHFGL